MASCNEKQRCAVCAWRATCAKRFSVQDGGARCPDYSRDVTIKSDDAERQLRNQEK